MHLAPELDQQMHDAYMDAMRLVASVMPEATIERVADWFLYDAGVDNPEFNIAVAAGDPARAAVEVTGVEDWYGRRGSDWRFKLRPGPDFAVITALEGRAAENQRREPYMWRSLEALEPAPAPGLRIERVSDERGLTAYDSFDAARGRPHEWSIAAAVMALPECSLWLGWAGEELAARAMAVATAPVGTIHNVVVAEPFRRRGFGRAITAAAALACREGGSSSVCLGASRMGYSLYLEMGFEHRYDLATFAPLRR